MKKQVPTRKKFVSLLFCLMPVVLVGIISKLAFGGLAHEIFEPFASVPQSIKKSYSQTFSPDNSGMNSKSAGPSQKDQKVLSAVVSSPPEIALTSLTEADWLDRVILNGSTLQGEADCFVPKAYAERFAELTSSISNEITELSFYKFQLGKLLRKSRGKDCNASAFELFKAAAEGGFDKAHAEIANAYRKGLGVEPDYLLAIEHFKISARLGYANSAYRLVEMVERGTADFPGNGAKASEFLDEFLPLIKDKVRQGDAVAARSLARLYGNSNLLQRNINKAIELYTFAAELGDEIAMHDLAFMLIEYRQESLKREDVFPLLLRSSELGYSAAFTAIGRLHLKQMFGFARSAAPRWFRRGVEAGHPGAMKELAELYFAGEVVKKDVQLAKELAEQGARLKHMGSKRLLKMILEAKSQQDSAG